MEAKETSSASSIPNALKRAREKKGWSQSQLAEAVGLSQGHISDIISEEDTYYARALSSTFMESQPRPAHPFDVRRYTYLRGIDGKLPSDEKDEKERHG
jgi:transcriptional regulator with XRE-family HTH domain